MGRESKFKIGDRVVATKTFADITAGNGYTVAEVDHSDDDMPIRVVDDAGDRCWLYSDQFRILTPTIEPGKHYRTRSGKPTGRVTVGDTGFEAVVDGKVRIYDAAGGHVHGDSDLDVVEAWVPRVGERVRRFKGHNPGSVVGHEAVVRAIEDIIPYDSEGPWLLFDDDTSGYATSFEPLPVAPQPTAQEPALKIEAGRYYRTRDGLKVGPMKTHSGSGLIEIHGDGRVWELDGGHRKGCRDTMNYSDDLIAEWPTAQSNVGAQVDTLAEEYGSAPQPEPDTTLHIKFTSDFSELDAAILVRKKKLKKLIKLARKAGIELREAA